MIAILDGYVNADVRRNRLRLEWVNGQRSMVNYFTNQSIASSRVSNGGNSRCEKFLKFS
jgi:hypothetical protein